MAANQRGSAWAPPPLTGLVEGRFTRLLLQLADGTVDIRDLFLPTNTVAHVRERFVDIGQGRGYTVLDWDETDDDHVPGMASLLRFLQANYGPTQPPVPIVGPRGPRGARGLCGYESQVALRGARGPTGDQGRPGRAGACIELLPLALRGRQGLRGEAGIAGPRGHGSVTWLDAGPRGARGPPGMEGVRGARGLCVVG